MALRGVKFGEYHTSLNWGLILNSKTISPPTPKTTYTAIPGRDGDLDQSEALTGVVNYNDRVLTFVFLMTDGNYYSRETLLSEILKNIHGKRLDIVLDDDTSVYFNGRCEVKEVINNNAYGSVTIEATCNPFRLNFVETTKTITLTSSNQTITLVNNGGKTLIPTLTVSNSATITYATGQITLDAGTYQFDKIVLKTGSTNLNVRGSGTLKFTYREGRL